MFFALTLSASLCAESVSKVNYRIDSFSMQQVREHRVHKEMPGTWLVVSLVHPEKKLIGIDIKNSEISFTDDQGTDLFEAGRTQDKIWKRNSSSYSPSSEAIKENSLSMAFRSTYDRREKNDREAMFQCYATALPAAGAQKLHIQGSLVLLTESKAIETQIVTIADLLGDKVMLGDQELNLRDNGGGVYTGKNTFVRRDCKSNVDIKSIELVEKTDQKYTIRFEYSKRSNSPSVLVFKKNVKLTDKVKIEYGIPDRETVQIDMAVGPGVSFLSGN